MSYEFRRTGNIIREILNDPACPLTFFFLLLDVHLSVFTYGDSYYMTYNFWGPASRAGFKWLSYVGQLFSFISVRLKLSDDFVIKRKIQ